MTAKEIHAKTMPGMLCSADLSHAPAGRAVKRPVLEKAVEAYSVFTPAKRPVLKIGDVNTMWFVKPKGRDSEES